MRCQVWEDLQERLVLGDRQRTEWCDPVRSRRVTYSWTVNAATFGLYLAAGDFSGGFPPTSCGTARAGIHRADQRLRMRSSWGRWRRGPRVRRYGALSPGCPGCTRANAAVSQARWAVQGLRRILSGLSSTNEARPAPVCDA